MAFGTVYIDRLHEKIIHVFHIMRQNKKSYEKEFIRVFVEQYPDDYQAIVDDWKVKVQAYKKRRKGNPVPYAVRPEKILGRMYRCYYYEMIKKPELQRKKKAAAQQAKTNKFKNTNK